MRFIALFPLCFIALVAYTSAQMCSGRASCTGGLNVGRGGRGCIPRTMWYYDARFRQCRQMRYLGCGGNNNVWCTRIACERRCRR